MFLAAVGAAFWSAAVLAPKAPAAMPLGQTIYDTPSPEEESLLAIPTDVPDAMLGRIAYAGADLASEFACLSLNVYWEAKGEPVAGQMAVAAVTLNRLNHPRFPKTICEVVWQGVDLGRNRCQFSWACDRRTNEPRSEEAWARAQQVAYRAMFLDPTDPVDGALYFHANYVRPGWSYEKARVMRIGRHIFYADPPPVWSVEELARNGRS